MMDPEVTSIDSKLRKMLLAGEEDLMKVNLFKVRLRNLSKTSKLYAEVGQDLNVFSDKCVQEIFELGTLDTDNQRLYKVFGETLRELEAMRRICMEQMNLLLATPLLALSNLQRSESFGNGDVGIETMRERVYAARDKYDGALRKFALLQASPPSEKLARADADVEVAKNQFEVLNRDYRLQLKEVDGRMKMGVLEQLCMFMYVQRSSYVQGRLLLSDIEPKMRTQLAKLERARNSNWQRELSIRLDSFAVGKERQGYLFKRNARNVGQRWLIRWFVVREGKLCWYKKWKTLEPKRTVDLLQCSVRVPNDSDLCFQLVAPNFTATLRALTEQDRSEWIRVIENAGRDVMQQHIEQSGPPRRAVAKNEAASSATSLPLTDDNDDDDDDDRDGQADNDNDDDDDQSQPANARLGVAKPPLNKIRSASELAGDVVLAELQSLSVHNCVCADCGAPDPEWASLSVGVLVCIDCSSAHRALASLNKIRSLALDKFEDEHLELFRAIGNARANEFFEFDVGARERPSAGSSLDDKAAWIRAKYEQRLFMQSADSESRTPEALAQQMYEAVVTEDLLAMMKMRAFSADVNAVNEADLNRTLLHFAVLARNPAALELLLHYGAELGSADADAQSALHYAFSVDARRCAYLLLKRGLDPHAVDMFGVTPASIVGRANKQWALRLINEASKRRRDSAASASAMPVAAAAASKDDRSSTTTTLLVDDAPPESDQGEHALQSGGGNPHQVTVRSSRSAGSVPAQPLTPVADMLGSMASSSSSSSSVVSQQQQPRPTAATTPTAPPKPKRLHRLAVDSPAPSGSEDSSMSSMARRLHWGRRKSKKGTAAAGAAQDDEDDDGAAAPALAAPPGLDMPKAPPRQMKPALRPRKHSRALDGLSGSGSVSGSGTTIADLHASSIGASGKRWRSSSAVTLNGGGGNLEHAADALVTAPSAVAADSSGHLTPRSATMTGGHYMSIDIDAADDLDMELSQHVADSDRVGGVGAASSLAGGDGDVGGSHLPQRRRLQQLSAVGGSSLPGLGRYTRRKLAMAAAMAENGELAADDRSTSSSAAAPADDKPGDRLGSVIAGTSSRLRRARRRRGRSKKRNDFGDGDDGDDDDYDGPVDHTAALHRMASQLNVQLPPGDVFLPSGVVAVAAAAAAARRVPLTIDEGDIDDDLATPPTTVPSTTINLVGDDLWSPATAQWWSSGSDIDDETESMFRDDDDDPSGVSINEVASAVVATPPTPQQQPHHRHPVPSDSPSHNQTRRPPLLREISGILEDVKL
jgi:Putative GTPase activating protein for Arf/BAR domain of APPL family/PH domain/Ankyrin repeats (3 copies)